MAFAFAETLHGTFRGTNSTVKLILLGRYLDPDPMLLASRRGLEGKTENPKFHALNQAIVQLVSSRLMSLTFAGSLIF